MPLIQRAIGASFDNQMSRFLVGYCVEQEGLETRLSVLYDGYIKVLRYGGDLYGNDKRPKCMSLETFANRITGARLRMVVHTPKATYRYRAVLGVALDEQAIAGLQKTAAEPVMAAQLIPPPPKRKHGEEWFEPKPNGSSHVRVGKQLFKREQVVSMRPIRPFMRHGTDEECEYIVTFDNGELRPAYLTAQEAEVLRSDLG
jgi:hypothetical protein